MAAAHGLRAAAFLDRDGVINHDAGYTSRIEDFRFLPGVLDAAASLARAGLALVVVTNQSGIARGLYGLPEYTQLTDWMRGRFAAHGAPLAGVYHCPHHPTEGQGAWRVACDCRKPAPGMLLQACRELALDPARSLMFGDRCDDMRAAHGAGVGLRVLLGHNALAEPAGDCTQASPGLAFRSLAHAVADPRLAQWMQAPRDDRPHEMAGP
jgi:D-glycero-D-manno-heptose 1,7-bisphosphate phosphatase